MTPEHQASKAESKAQTPGLNEAAPPAVGPEERLTQQVADALAAIPGGDQLNRYFGFSSGQPEQAPAEAARSEELVGRLRRLSTDPRGGDLSKLIGDISAHATGSGADPDALRALMRGSRIHKPAETDQNEPAVVPRTAPVRVTAEAIIGCLIGTAVGDSIALPYEGISARRQARMRGGELRQSLLLGRGMVSDDTEHTVMLAQSLIAARDLTEFKRDFARRLRVWAALVPAGIGFGTLRAGLKLWLGFSPDKSGVASAGNGPCMRSALLGLLFGDDPQKLIAYVQASSRITHTDPRATSGALAVAVAAHVSAASDSFTPSKYLKEVSQILTLNGDAELTHLLARVVRSVEAGEQTKDFASALGLSRGVSGFVLHTVPVAIHAWLSFHDNFEKSVATILACGGDTDTTAAIVGAIVGARVKEEGIPTSWIDGIWEPTFGPKFLQTLGARLSQSQLDRITCEPPEVPLWKRLARNTLFLGIVLAHGFRRLAPPY